ncbi:filamentous hemagglutinin N-terminal domain-containing protein [Campylobacter lari]|nr:filamentous hemagglutinin N-terminal domain-containing protein [Campylobacter lari]
MSSFSNHILLSGIVISILFDQSLALPSGGKFTHGTSGSISINDNHMNIHGNGQNSVIQWGGGFSIGKNESVNFNGSNKNYLNIAHGTNKSTIEGLLNASGNNVFLINPNGVIITKTGTINANRFVASTSSISSDEMQKFANGKTNTIQSPIIKLDKNNGNVVNMGNINAEEVVFIGNKILLNSNIKNSNDLLTKINSKNIKLIGNEIDIDASNINANSLSKLEVSAKERGSIYLNASGYYYDPNSFAVFDKLKQTDFQNIKHNNSSFNIYDFVGISSDVDWWHFAKGWNENKKDFRNTATEYRLTNDIDFKGKNYANYCIEGYGCTNMIVGYKDPIYNDDWEIIEDNSFYNKIFDGQNFALKNIFIDTNVLSDSLRYVGIFGNASGSEFKNIIIDYNDNSILSNSMYTGGFIGYASGGSKFENIELKNISKISTQNKNNLYAGGFIGYVNGANFNKIDIKSIREISGISLENRSHIGGFVGGINNGKFENINISQINKIINDKTTKATYTGGFAGEVWGGKFSNIDIRQIDEINGGFVTGGFSGNIGYADLENINLDINNITSTFTTLRHTYAGGFVGSIDSGDTYFKNINVRVKNVKSISQDNKDGSLEEDFFDTGNAYAGGFVGFANGGVFDNISIEAEKIESINNNSMEGTRAASGGFAGKIEGYRSDNLSLSNITIKNIDTISGKIEKDKSGMVNVGGFAGWIQKEGKGSFSDISIYDIKNIQAYGQKDFANAAGFIGYIEGRSMFQKFNLDFKNIYLFFENDAQIQSFASDGKNLSGKFISAYNDKNVNLAFKNIHIYHHENDFNDVFSDLKLWKDMKINIHTYNDDNKNLKFEDFLSKDNTIARPIIELPKKPDFSNKIEINYPNIDNIIQEEAILGKDDLYEDVIKNEILADLINQHYKIYIDVLLDMLAEKDYNLMTEDEKVDFVAKYFIKDTANNKSQALKIVQSLDFIMAYQNNGLNNANDDKFEEGVKDFYQNNIKSNIDKTIEKKISILEILKGELKDIVLNSQQLLKELENIKLQLQIAEKSYNDYIKNNSSLDPNKLAQLLKNINILEKQQEAIASKLGLTEIKNKIEYQHNKGSFLIMGDYQYDLYKPILESIDLTPSIPVEPDLPWTDLTPSIPNIPTLENNQAKSSLNNNQNYPAMINDNIANLFLFNSLGDDLVKDEIIIKEIGELDIEAHKKTCIVSDGFKAMNPCAN